MATRLPTATRNAATNAVTAQFDAGPAAATIEVRTGAQPASANDAATGTLLATWTLADPSWGASVTGTAPLDATPVITTAAVAAGTAGWWRAKDSTGATVVDGAAGGTGSGAELILDNPVIAIGQTLNLTAGTLTTPAST
jgi:hypothetical protein